jgi:hypothetical protein
MNGLFERNAVADLIRSGKQLLLAGDETLLAALPRGRWIGGTIPYFMAEQGGVHTKDRIYVTELPAGGDATIRSYDARGLDHFAKDHPGHGFTVLLIPAFSDTHSAYAHNASEIPGIFDRPVVGWISGVALDDIGRQPPKVFDGSSATASAANAVAMHVRLPPEEHAMVDIVNLFAKGDGDRITFAKPGFSASTAEVNGRTMNFAEYLTGISADIKLPLVADYHGAMVNVSFQSVDAGNGGVKFYAPVFPGIEYRIAAPVNDYVASFADQFDAKGPQLSFSCNCILNYVYAGLEGRSIGRLAGPMTFGEIAYMLLNQTAVYLTIEKD